MMPSKTLLLAVVVVVAGCASRDEPMPARPSVMVQRNPEAVRPDRSWYPYPPGVEIVDSEKTRREIDVWESVFSPETYYERTRYR